MASIFAITTTTEDTKADSSGRVAVVFTVTNTLHKPVRGTAKAKPLGNTQQEWLDVEGEVERDFSAGDTQVFTVNFHKPVTAAAAGSPALPAEKFPFRLDVFSSANPEEQFTEGPTVRAEVTPAVLTTPPPKFPWWIILIIAGAVLLIGAIILFFVFSGRGGGKFSGTWVNTTQTAPQQPSVNFLIAKMEIEQSGNELKVHAFNKCTPADCDWGVVTGKVEDGVGKVTFDHGLILHKMEIKEDGEGKLKTTVASTFRYSGSPAQSGEFSYTKQPTLPPPPSPVR